MYLSLNHISQSLEIKVLGRENDGEWFGMRCLLSAIPRIFFQPAKFENFKDETNSDYKTVSVPKRKKRLLD